MIKYISITGFVAFFLLLNGCGKGESSTEIEEPVAKTISPETAGDEHLTSVQEAAHVFQNTLILLTGSLQMAFSGIGGTKIHKDEMYHTLDSLSQLMTTQFKKMEASEPKAYDRLFGSANAQQGLVLARKSPEGFRPVTQRLRKEDFEQYLTHLTDHQDDDEDDPVVQYLKNLTDWFTRVSQEWSEDEDLNEILSKLESNSE